MCIASIRIHPEGETIKVDTEIVQAGDMNPYWIFGDDKAQAAAKPVFSTNRATNRDLNFLQRLACRAVKAGISAAGANPLGSDPACGGHLFVRSTSI
jgi:hypothetical protein